MKKASEALPNKLLIYQRLQRCWSQKELAELVGTTTINVSRWERGITFPNAHFRHQLCRLFDKEEEALGLVSHATISADASSKSVSPDKSMQLDIWYVPFQRNPLFTAREEIIGAIHNAFHATRSTTWRRPCVLSGAGGIGKTEIALEYVYRHWQEYQAVLWIDASTSQTLATSIIEIASLLSQPEKEEDPALDPVEYIKSWLQTSTNGLLILDNRDDLESISPLLSLVHNNHILLTTRTQILGTLVSHIDIEPMTIDEGTLFLLRRVKYIGLETPLEEAPEALRVHASYIVQAMGGFPLALDQAGAYTEETACGLSSYLLLYQTQSAPLLSRRGSAARHPASVVSTFLYCIEKVEQANALAADILRVCTFCACNVISEEEVITQCASQAADRLQFDTAIAELRKYSLICRDSHAQMLTIHPLTKVVLKERYGQDAASQQPSSSLPGQAPSSSFPELLSTSERNPAPRRVRPLRPFNALVSLKRASRFFMTMRGILVITNIIAICSFILFATSPLINAGKSQSTSQSNMGSWTKEMQLETRSFQEKGIGLSYGNVIFDTYPGRTDVSLKNEAASCLQQQNTSCAINFMTQAISADPTDGEIQIYNDNLHVLQSGAPYVTAVLGLAVASDATDLLRARAIMQAAFLAQREINDGGLLPAHLRLRILIDNSGSNNANVATAAQFVANRVRAGNPDHIIAVVGWPFSSQTTNALDVITGANIPLISQTASSTTLSGDSPYFFRVNPTDNQQGQTLADVAVKQFHASNILLAEDPTDPYSVSLAKAFSQHAADLKANLIVSSATNFTIGVTSVDAYQNIVKEAESQQADLIFLAGFDVDAVRLAHALGDAARKDPGNTILEHLKVMSGDAVATGLPLGQGGGPDAQIARQFPKDMQRLIFSSFAHPDEWAFEHIPSGQWPVFFSDWFNTYKNIALDATSSFQPGSHAILTYDAVELVLRAVNLTPPTVPVTGDAIRKALVSLGRGKIPPFQGVSGLISFDDQGDPVNKAFVLLDIENIGGQNTIVLKQVVGLF